jgi:hypothetical protein
MIQSTSFLMATSAPRRWAHRRRAPHTLPALLHLLLELRRDVLILVFLGHVLMWIKKL